MRASFKRFIIPVFIGTERLSPARAAVRTAHSPVQLAGGSKHSVSLPDFSGDSVHLKSLLERS